MKEVCKFDEISSITGHERAVAVLLSNGASVNIKSGNEKSPKMVAIEKGNFIEIFFLI